MNEKLTIVQFSEKIGRSRQWVYMMIKEGLPVHRNRLLGTCVDEDEALAWLNEDLKQPAKRAKAKDKPASTNPKPAKKAQVKEKPGKLFDDGLNGQEKPTPKRPLAGTKGFENI